MVYINGRKILTCIYGGQVIPITFNIGEGNGEGGDSGGVAFSTLSDVGKYALFELEGKALSAFK